MTRREFEVTDPAVIREILDGSKFLHLGLVDDGMPYVVPMNYGDRLEDGKLITEPGKYGRLVITNFFRQGRPCIRFDTKDIACWAEERCSCGRTYRLIKGGVQGRTDHLLKVRGTFFNPATVEDIVARDQRCSHEYRIVIQKDNYSIELLAEAAEGVEEACFPRIAADLEKEISNAAFLRLCVKILPYGSLERSDAKTKRVIDLREKRC